MAVNTGYGWFVEMKMGSPLFDKNAAENKGYCDDLHKQSSHYKAKSKDKSFVIHIYSFVYGVGQIWFPCFRLASLFSSWISRGVEHRLIAGDSVHYEFNFGLHAFEEYLVAFAVLGCAREPAS
jgi:hypothetical protein